MAARELLIEGHSLENLSSKTKETLEVFLEKTGVDWLFCCSVVDKTALFIRGK
jgi:hypothetical protein